MGEKAHGREQETAADDAMNLILENTDEEVTAAGKIDFSMVLANAIHDMKNSISMLIDGLERIDMRGINESAQGSLPKLRYEGKRINNGLVHLLTLYRISESSYSLMMAEHNVEEMLFECKCENEDLLSLKGIAIDTDVEGDLQYFFDRELIASVINSVLNNAYKYTKDRILLRAYVKDGYLSLLIEDNGPGYPAFMMELDPEQQREISYKTSSTGLGTYFAATIAKMHRYRDRQGSIVIDNNGIDGGGRFEIRLPV